VDKGVEDGVADGMGDEAADGTADGTAKGILVGACGVVCTPVLGEKTERKPKEEKLMIVAAMTSEKMTIVPQRNLELPLLLWWLPLLGTGSLVSVIPSWVGIPTPTCEFRDTPTGGDACSRLMF
jgi:hypothetical protein